MSKDQLGGNDDWDLGDGKPPFRGSAYAQSGGGAWGEDDLRQEALLKLLRKQQDEKGVIERPLAWIGQVMIDLSHSLGRKEARRRELLKSRSDELVQGQGASGEGVEPSAAWHAEKREIARRVREEVRLLKPMQREAIQLAFFEGATPAEIALHWGIKQEAARSRVWRAVEALKKRLKGKGFRGVALFEWLPWATELAEDPPVPISSASAAGASVATAKPVLVAAALLFLAGVALVPMLTSGEEGERVVSSASSHTTTTSGAPQVPQVAPGDGERRVADTPDLVVLEGRVRQGEAGVPLLASVLDAEGRVLQERELSSGFEGVVRWEVGRSVVARARRVSVVPRPSSDFSFRRYLSEASVEIVDGTLVEPLELDAFRVDAEVQGVASTADGAPAVGAIVSSYNFHRIADEEGRFTLPASSRIRILQITAATPDGLAEGRARAHVGPGGEAADVRIVLTPVSSDDEPKSDAETSLESFEQRVSGVVVNADGEALPNARVKSGRTTTMTGAAGDFELIRLPMLGLSAYLEGEGFGKVPARSLSRGDPIEIVLQPPDPFEAVTRDEGGNPLPFVKVAVTYEGFELVERSDHEGRVRFEGVPDHVRELRASLPGYVDFARFDVDLRSAPDLPIVLEPSGKIRMRVFDRSTRAPIENLVVQVKGVTKDGKVVAGYSDGAWRRPVHVSEQDGRIVLHPKNEPPLGATAELAVAAVGYRERTVVLTIGTASDAIPEVELSPDLGIGLDPSGAPKGGLVLRVSEEFPRDASIELELDGVAVPLSRESNAYVAEELVPGRYFTRLYVEHVSTGGMARRAILLALGVDVREGPAREIVLRRQGEGAVEIRLLEHEQYPQQLRVFLTPRATDASHGIGTRVLGYGGFLTKGRLLLDGLPVGEYRVELQDFDERDTVQPKSQPIRAEGTVQLRAGVTEVILLEP